MTKRKFSELVIKFWGIMDGLAFLWYIGWNIYKNRMPFVYDIKTNFLEAAPQMGICVAVALSVFVFLSYMSLSVSGHLLFRVRKSGMVIAFIQVPLRILTIIPPSVFFILWPLGYFIEAPRPVLGFSVVATVELIKILSIIYWWLSER